MFPVIPSHQIQNKFYVVEVIELVVGQVFGLHKVAGLSWPLPYSSHTIVEH